MKKNLTKITVLCTVLILCIAFTLLFLGSGEKLEDMKAEQIVDLNEIEQLSLQGDSYAAAQKIHELQNKIKEMEVREAGKYFPLFVTIFIGILWLVSFYIYWSVLRPFKKMQDFAEQIAKGDFNVPLDYERKNYFGKFTWAFESMRKEITKARASEKEAIENNQTIIATLSHDIKTPIASIRAYAEGMEANMDNTPEKRAKYLSVIMRKCDEVSGLTNDLLLHSIANLDKLQIIEEEVKLCSFLQQAVKEISGEEGDVYFHTPSFDTTVFVDSKRLMQIMENIINNARKYAKTKIDVSVEKNQDNIEIYIRDYGKGIADEDIPFIFDKFYRGKNSRQERGSGLGLYIVKYLTMQMGGDVRLYNCEKGLEVVVAFQEKR